MTNGTGDSPAVYRRSCHVAGHLWIAFLLCKIRYAAPTVMICPKKHFYGYLGENNIDSLVL